MRYLLLALNLGLVHFWPAYRKAVGGLFGLSLSLNITYVVAGSVGFLAAWAMARGFMTHTDAKRIAGKLNEPERIYNRSTHRLQKNPRDASADSIKFEYLLCSFGLWLVQVFFIYKAVKFY